MAESEKTMMKNCIFAHRLGAINCNLARSTVVVSSTSEDQNHSRLYCTDRQLCIKTFKIDHKIVPDIVTEIVSKIALKIVPKIVHDIVLSLKFY